MLARLRGNRLAVGVVVTLGNCMWVPKPYACSVLRKRRLPAPIT